MKMVIVIAVVALVAIPVHTYSICIHNFVFPLNIFDLCFYRIYLNGNGLIRFDSILKRYLNLIFLGRIETRCIILVHFIFIFNKIDQEKEVGDI